MCAIANTLSSYVISLRRYFHAHPELSMKEYHTAEKIAAELTKLQIPFYRIAETGIVAEVKNGVGKSVLLRADIDALPLQEHSEAEYCSQVPGIMHACGHDCHTAMLLGAAKLLSENLTSFSGTIRLLFQPAEETGQASKKIIESGILNDIDSVFSIHVEPSIPSGYYAVQSGAIMAGVDDFSIQIQSMGGHGAYPHLGSDAVLTAAHTVINLQQFVSREMPPLAPVVLTVGTLHAGTKANILANEATLTGNIRFFDSSLRDTFPDILNRIATHTAEAFKSTATVTYTRSLLPVINEPEHTQIAISAADCVFGKERLMKHEVSTASDDFSRFASECPGVYLFLGTSDSTQRTSYPIHNEYFDVDENILERGSYLFFEYAKRCLNTSQAET